MTIILSIIIFVLVVSVMLAHMKTKSHVEIEEERKNVTLYFTEAEIREEWKKLPHLQDK